MLGLLTPPDWSEYGAILPGAIPCLTALLLILLNVFHKGSETSRDYQAYVSAIGLGVSTASVWLLWDDTVARPVFHGMLYLDKFTLFFAGLFSASGILACLLSPKYLSNRGLNRPEYYLLLLSSVTGMNFLAAAADLMTFFVAFEVMSIPIYCVAGYLRKRKESGEAAMKYFILGAFSSALMLYGIALLYGATGTTNLEFIGRHVLQIMASPEGGGAMLTIFGALLLLSGFAFKIASVPFHLWTPDVYTGSPTPSVGFMATAVKASAFAPMIRVFQIAFGHVAQTDVGGVAQSISMRGGFYALRGGFLGYGWVDILMVVAGASMVLGNLVAITQNNVKRMLAYSTIAHAGYILVGFVAAGAKPGYFLYNDAVLFYLLTYTFGTLGAFGVLTYFDRRNDATETYEDLAGLGFEYPTVGLLMGIFMFSSAGIPPTAGFVGKLYIFRGAVDVGQATGEFAFIGLAILAVLTSVAGVYYYLRVLVYMYMKEGDRDLSDTDLEHPSVKGALVVCGLLTLYLGIFPAKALDLSREAVVDFTGAPPAVQEVLDRAEAQQEAASE
jgi:NADH-quinone oxidoreductase subunit N